MQTPIGIRYRVGANQPSTYADAKKTLAEVKLKLKINDAWILKATTKEIADARNFSSVKSPDIVSRKKQERTEDKKKADKFKNQSKDKTKETKSVEEMHIKDIQPKQQTKNEDIVSKGSESEKTQLKEQIDTTSIAKTDINVDKVADKTVENKETETLNKKNDIIVEQSPDTNDIAKVEEQSLKEVEKSKKLDIVDPRKLAANDDANKGDENANKIPKVDEIDWSEFKSQYLIFIKAVESLNYDKIQEYIDDNGFIAMRDLEGTSIADHYIHFKTLVDLINYYGRSYKKNDFIQNVKKYNIPFLIADPLPNFTCNTNKYNKNGMFSYTINPYDLGFAGIIENSELISSIQKAKNVLSSTNTGVVRAEIMQLKGFYFTFINGKLLLRFIDFTDLCP